ncbi:hypothetical protein [Bosea sp. PAMC 26642]|uniref:hypothetical protein n=1 Tax=Bosea sp. (strain PAMC 26642) TaxID=1792307 RepID=UPI0007700BFF|nr:hypothetical protein [Bosea sp. PAMC 26642]AMJ59309.1 hypothetical protein AXW83_02430 [Bosea sp. PAMC 26642]
MLRTIHPKIRSTFHTFGRVVRDTYCARLVAIAHALWRDIRILSCFVIVLLIFCFWSASNAALRVFGVVAPNAGWLLLTLGLLAALLAFIVVLELCAAVVTTGLTVVLQLSHDTGRHIIGTMLTMLAIVACVFAVLQVQGDGGRSLAAWVAPSIPIAAALTALAFWFDRAYRRPAYPGFRDFRADVVDARQFMMRASHVH